MAAGAGQDAGSLFGSLTLSGHLCRLEYAVFLPESKGGRKTEPHFRPGRYNRRKKCCARAPGLHTPLVPACRIKGSIEFSSCLLTSGQTSPLCALHKLTLDTQYLVKGGVCCLNLQFGTYCKITYPMANGSPCAKSLRSLNHIVNLTPPISRRTGRIHSPRRGGSE